MTADTGNMQGELDTIWEHLLPTVKDKALPADAAGQDKLKQAIDQLVAHPVKKEK